MKEHRFIAISCLILLMGSIFLGGFSESVLAASNKNSVVLGSKSKKNVKVESIHSKKALLKSIEKHLEKFDTEISYKIPKKVIKSIGAFDRLFLSRKNKKLVPAALLSKVDYYNYSYYFLGQHFFVRLDIKYKDSKRELKNYLSKLKKLESSPILSSETEIREAFFSHYHNLEKDFSLKVSREFLKPYKNKVDNFLKSLENEPRYNDLKWDYWVNGEAQNFSKFTVLHFSTQTKKSKEELKKIIQTVSPVLKTREEVFSEILSKSEKIEKRYSINIGNHVLGYEFGDGKKFWDELYDIPEFNDLSHHNEDGSYTIEKFKGYFKLTMNDQFTIRKEEVDTLKSYVKTWVAENIKPEMTEEEKVRAINDFMVKEYRYTYGDRGQLFEKEEGNEKLGKYSVYTCFALIDGKGGVCNAKANMFYRLAKEAGLEVLYVTGNVSTGLHAWNMVKVDGVWYHLDNTWNRGQYEGSSEYDYFNTRDYYLKSGETMRKDHTWDASKYPAAPMDYQGYVPTASVGNRVIFERAA